MGTRLQQVVFWWWVAVLAVPLLIVATAYVTLTGREVPKPMPEWLHNAVTGLLILELLIAAGVVGRWV